jgi:hypothetical protein
MAFQDFEYITERRRAEKQRKLSKRIAIAAVSAFVLMMFTLSPLYTFPHWPILPLSSKRDVLPFSNDVKLKGQKKKKKNRLLRLNLSPLFIYLFYLQQRCCSLNNDIEAKSNCERKYKTIKIKSKNSGVVKLI